MGIYDVEASKTAKLKKAYDVNKDQKLEKLKKAYVVNKDQKLEKLWSGFTPKFVSYMYNNYLDQVNKKGLIDSYSYDRGLNLVGYSEDGINWRYRQSGLLDTTINTSMSRYKNVIACGNEVTVILAGYGKIQYSEDCINWTEVIVDSSSDIYVRGIINFCDGMFIFMTYNNSTYVTNVYTSTNGKTWTKKGTIPKLANYTSFGDKLVTNIVPYTYNGTKGYLCAINNPDGNIYDYLFFSTNLITWTKLSTAISAMYIREIYVVRGDVRIIGYAEGNLGIYYGSKIDGKYVQYPSVRLNFSDYKFGEYLSSVVVGEGDKESILIYAQNSSPSRELFVINYFSNGGWSEDAQSAYVYDGYTSNSQRMIGPGYGDGKCTFLVWNDTYNTSTVSSYIMPYDESTGNLSAGTRTELHQGPPQSRMAKILYTK